MSSIAERLEAERLPGESDRAFAKRAGLKWVTSLQDILGGKEPRERTINRLIENLGHDAAYWRYGINTHNGEERCQTIS